MIYEIWNEVSPINNVSSEKIFSYREDINEEIKNDGSIILIKKNETFVEEIAFESKLRNEYNFGQNLSVEEVAQEYLKTKQKEEDSSKDIENKISILESENATLKVNLEATQQAVDFIVMNGGM